jgi:hypothetical protein
VLLKVKRMVLLFLGHDVVYFSIYVPTFRINILRIRVRIIRLVIMFGRLPLEESFYPEDGGSTFLRNALIS